LAAPPPPNLCLARTAVSLVQVVAIGMLNFNEDIAAVGIAISQDIRTPSTAPCTIDRQLVKAGITRQWFFVQGGFHKVPPFNSELQDFPADVMPTAAPFGRLLVRKDFPEPTIAKC
jgi:hypothetical protein